MANLKRISVSEKCTLCGLCEQDELNEVFQLDSDIYQMRPLNNGLIDIDKYPMVLEVCADCPAGAITIEAEQTVAGSRAEILDKLNQMIYHDLRDFPFIAPDESEYEYETGKYYASKIPAQYRSAQKYMTDDGAEKAGVAEFKRSVWCQYKAIARQYITDYKVKKLKQYFTYEENEGNFYFKLNKKVELLLQEVVQLAKAATDGKISLPEDFAVFEAKPNWGYEDSYQYIYQHLEEFQFDYERSTFFHQADYYDSWVSTDGDDRYYYDFEEAEAEFRDDIDRVVESVLPSIAKQRVEEVTGEYFKSAKSALSAKLDIVQRELKNHIKIDKAEVFKQELEKVYIEILKTPIPNICIPSLDMDLEVNSDYRFYSESSRDEAAEHRRERAYDEGRHYVRRLPDTLSESCADSFGKILTQWKRSILRAYDMSGINYPSKRLCISYDNSKTPTWTEDSQSGMGGFWGRLSNCIIISLDNFDEVEVRADDRVKQFIDSDLLHYGTAVNNVEYISEYSVKITTDYDYDLKETLFGGLKEVNRRYAYNIYRIHDFKCSARAVAEECIKALRDSHFFKDYFARLKQNIIDALRKETGIS